MVQFKEDAHRGEADMNLLGVIPDVGTALRITCKDKGSVLHQRLKACMQCGRILPVHLVLHFWCLVFIFRRLRRNLHKIKTHNTCTILH